MKINLQLPTLTLLALSSFLFLPSLPPDIHAQASPSAPEVQQVQPPPTPYTIAARGPHHAVWQRVTIRTNEFGRVLATTNSYTELATGMHFWNEGISSWQESREQFDITNDGYAVATNGQHKVTLPPDIGASNAVVDLRTPDGQQLLSRPLFLSFHDNATGTNALLAAIGSSTGLLIGDNVVVYPEALGSASFRYTYTKAAFEQDLVLYRRLPSPTDFDLTPETTTLEIWSEFLSQVEPAITATNALGDLTLDFGQMRMGHGLAYLINGESTDSIGLQKSWVTIDGRHFLVESVPYTRIKPLSDLLQASAGSSGTSRTALLTFPNRAKLVAQASRPNAAFRRFASIRPAARSRQQGLVLDYQVLNSNQSGYTFYGDTTYYVSGPVNLSGTTTLEGSTVIKIAPTNNSTITLAGSSVWTGSSYRPSLLTGRDDDSAGQTIAGSTANPSTNSYGTYLKVSDNSPINYARICYATKPIRNGGGATGYSLSHVQLVNCDYAIDHHTYGDDTPVTLENVLLYKIKHLTAGSSDTTVFSGAHVTLIQVTNTQSESVTLTNSIFAACSGFSGGLSNAFPTSVTDTFQTVGASGAYLADNSVYRNAGSTNISATLQAALRTLTTYPPIVFSNIAITTDLLLSPQAQRDTDTPDLGYHLAPLDFVFYHCTLSNALCQAFAGTAIGTAGSYGVVLRNGARFICQGEPTNPVRVARYNTVQEHANSNWDILGDSIWGNGWGEATTQVTCRFTDWSAPAPPDGSGFHFTIDNNPAEASFTDCQFHSGRLNAGNANLYLTNCLLERVATALADNTGAMSPTVRNCSFFGGSLSLAHWENTTWLFRDNLFDKTTISIDPDSYDVDNAYDGYSTGSNRITPTNSHDVVAGLTFKAGPLGNFYYTNNCAFLNAGTTNADLLGLYHYTVNTNLVASLQVKETNSVVDLGFHYVAVDNNGIPIDTDSDGWPDWYEDTNGNGSVNSGETDWQSATDLGLKVIITRPSTGSNLP